MTISKSVFTDGSVAALAYDRMRDQIRDGDLLLCSGSAAFSRLIQVATESIWSHVGFVMWLPSLRRLMVLESVESAGVRSVPLSSYLSDYNGTGHGYPGQVLIARHDDFANRALTPQFIEFAVDRFGWPYHTDEIIHMRRGSPAGVSSQRRGPKETTSAPSSARNMWMPATAA